MEKLQRTYFRASIICRKLYFHASYSRTMNNVVQKQNTTIRALSIGCALKLKSIGDELESLQEIDEIEEDEDGDALLQYYIDKADAELELDDIDDYGDIMDLDQKMYFKIIDVWLQQAGQTKRGHREFIKVLMNNMKKFNVQYNIQAYAKLFECYPQGPYTDIKRNNLFRKGFQGKRPDHLLAIELFKLIKYNGIEPVESLYNTCMDLFGYWSIATAHIRMLLFWSARFKSLNPNPIDLGDIAKMNPIEISFRGLVQMNPGLDTIYKKVTLNDTVDSPFLISSQSPSQLQKLQQHDVNKPLYVEGPQLTYFYGKRVFYYTLAADPASQLTEQANQTTILTDKEWWEEFYQTNLETGRKTYEGKYYTDDYILPKLNISPEIGFQKKWIEEIKIVKDDTKSVESEVFAISSCTDDGSGTNPDLLKNWVTSLQMQNAILSTVTVLFRENATFLLSDNLEQKEPKEDGFIPDYIEI